jgi:DNA polymerase I-like protein with 3'-5' exonuclease and polymerase domains
MSRAFKKEGLDAHVVIVVHDEFVIEAREDQAERVARVTEECMAKAFNHLIPDISMPCEAKIADYWSK